MTLGRGAATGIFFGVMIVGSIGSRALANEGPPRPPSSLAADDLYQKLRALEYAVPPVPATQTVEMGSWVAGGNFSGVVKTCAIVFSPFKHTVCTPPKVTIHAISAVLSFNVPNGVTLTANGKSVQSANGRAAINVGNAALVDWTLQSDTYSYSDQVQIARPDVAGMGAFMIAALPISIVYEPPQNAGLTNSATMEFASENTVIDTITNGSGTTSTPTWAGQEAALMVGQKMASITPVTSTVWPAISAVVSALSSEPKITNGTEVNTDHTLSVTMSDSEMVTTRAHRGPGHGDLIAFYRDARVIWGMDAGQVTLTLLDHAGLSIFTVDQLRADLTALANGGASASGLDANSISSLIALDPMAKKLSPASANTILGVPKLAASRFAKEDLVQIGGAAGYSHTAKHSITNSDRVSKLQTTTTVKESHGGWLTLLGIGSQTGGQTTTTVSLGASRTTSSTQTQSATFVLESGPAETQNYDVYYDNVFGTFLVRSHTQEIGPAQPAVSEKAPHESGLLFADSN